MSQNAAGSELPDDTLPLTDAEAALYRNPNYDRRLPIMAGAAAVIVSITLVVIKSWSWFETGSSAVLSSVVDSFIDILISATNLGAIWYASRPADDDHRHGHGKAEGVAALFQSAFIFGSAAFVLLQAVRFMTAGEKVTQHETAVAVMIVATVLNLGLVLFQTIVRRKTGSLAVEADQAHYSGDILIHMGVIGSLAADKYGGVTWADPVFAILVCIWLVFNARMIGVKAMGMLLDKELEPATRDRIIQIIRTHDGVMGAHDLRTRRSGRQMKMAIDIEVQPDLPLKIAHDIAMALEARLLAEFPGSEIMIHIDPFGEPEDSRHKHLHDMHIL